MSGVDTIFRGMRIAASGLTAERTRVDTIAENIANAQTTSTPEGGPYLRRVVRFEALMGERRGVRVTSISEDRTSPTERLWEPGHPDADAEGYVEMPNVNATLEMADLITAVRAYEANLTVGQSFERMAERALELAR